ncbi:MAG: RNA polymerase sigma-70 factor [Bacteroidota bacterium]
MSQPESYTDRQILDLLQKDEDKAMEYLFRRYYGFMCNAIYRVLPDKNLAEDLAQDVFYEFWKKRERVQINTSLQAYLKRAAVNKTLNYIRDRKMRFADEEELPKLENNQESSQQKLEEEELQALIRQSIDRLPERCRMVFVLSRYEELSYQEIADQLGISVKTVENQISKALKFLRESLRPFVGKGPLLLLLVQFF